MGSGGQAGQDASLSQEERPRADGKHCALSGIIGPLDFCKGFDNSKGFGFVLQDGLDITTNDDKNVKVIETFVSFFVSDLGTNDNSLIGDDLWLGRSNCDIEGLGIYKMKRFLV